MKNKFIIGIIFIFFFIFQRQILAAVRINEIYPAPTTGDKEWVELYNDEDKTIDLTGYTLIDLVNNKITFESDSISPYGYILGISSNVLNNTGDTVFLKNNLEETVETVVYSGTFTSDKVYVKCSNGNGNWYTLTTVTKSSSNETACLVLTPTAILVSTPTETPVSPLQPTPTISSTPGVESENQSVSYDNIYLSEAMVNPPSVNPPSGENEWIEVYNDNNFTVFLDKWYIDDIENAGSLPKVFSLTIPSKSYQVYQLSSSVFNNDGDQVRLLDFDKNLKDSFEYGSSTQGKTWGRTDFSTDSYCLQEPSKNSSNNSCLNPTSKPTSTILPMSTAVLTSTSTITNAAVVKNQSTMNNQSSTFYPRSSYYFSPVTITPVSAILGATTDYSAPSQKNIVRSLSFLSLTYSLLTIGSLLVKMKLC